MSSSKRKSLRISVLTQVGLTSLVLSSACAPSTFDDIEKSATVRSFEAPDNYRRAGYGSVIATYHGKSGSHTVSRFIASAGPDSPAVAQDVWRDDDFSHSSNIRCKKDKDCSKASGVAQTFAPFETWAKGTMQEHSGCIYAPGFPNAYIFCETNSGSSPTFKLGLPEDLKATTFHFSAAGLPPDHPLGLALVGVYTTSNRTGEISLGKLYYQPDLVKMAPPLREVRLMDPATEPRAPFSAAPDAGDLGYAVVDQANAAGELVIAVSQPSKNRVIVATYSDAIAVPPGVVDPSEQLNARIRVRACITSEDPALKGVGKKLAIGDVNNDGNPELFVGIDPLDGSNGDLQRVWMYPGTGLPVFDEQSRVCPLWSEKPVQVGCIDGIRGVECEGTAFGAALAVGDVDGDGFGDLLAGAPRANLQGEKEAGVAWLIPGSAGGLDFENTTNLYASNFKAKGKAGTAVGFVRTKDRDEPVVGAPGMDAVHMFLCTDLESDVSPDKLCIPK